MLGKLRLAWLQWPDSPLPKLIETVVNKIQKAEPQHFWIAEDDEVECALDAFLGLPAHSPCEPPGCPLHDPEFVKMTREEVAEITALIGKARPSALGQV